MVGLGPVAAIAAAAGTVNVMAWPLPMADDVLLYETNSLLAPWTPLALMPTVA